MSSGLVAAIDVTGRTVHVWDAETGTLKGGRICSHCNARGWMGGEMPTGGGGGGRACGRCGEKKLVRIDDGSPEVRFCTGCHAVLVVPET